MFENFIDYTRIKKFKHMKTDPEILSCEHGIFQKKLTLKPGESTLRHYHKETHETYCVLEGEGTIVIGGKNLPVQNGDFVSISAHTPHQITNDGLFPMKILSTKNKEDPKDTFAC